MIRINQAISLALIYNYCATDGVISTISVEEVENYQNRINRALQEMNSNSNDSENMFFYFISDSTEKGWYALKFDDQSVNRRKEYIMKLPLDVVAASQDNKALETIGIQFMDGKFVRKKTDKRKVRASMNQLIKSLTRKTNAVQTEED